MKKPIPFGKYLLLDRINVGGMAEVFFAKVFGEDGTSILAIKKILPTMVEDEEFISMFIDEARIAVQLDHQNIVQIFELGKFEENYYIAMEYVAGRDLRALLDRSKKRKEQLAIEQALFIASEMAHGLDYAHRAKDQQGKDLHIVHRDVSPQNILISYEGQVKLIDFGIAKAATRNQRTQAGILKGKFGYMSPEQVRGLPIDRRSDIFALGVILYEMLTGERLFVGESDFSILERVRNAEIPSPRRYNTNIPPELESIVLKALTREPADRYQWASELADDLMRFLGHERSGLGIEALAASVRSTFGEELLRERERMLRFSGIDRPEEVPLTVLRAFLPSRSSNPVKQKPVEDTAESAVPGDFDAPDTHPMPNPALGAYEGGMGTTGSGPTSGPTVIGGFGATSVDAERTVVPQLLERFGPPRRAEEGSITTDALRPQLTIGIPVTEEVKRVDNRAWLWALAVGTLLVVGSVGAVFWLKHSLATGSMVITTHPAQGVSVDVDAMPVTLDPDGMFVLRGLRPGDHRVVAIGPNGRRALKVTVLSDTITPVNIDLPPLPAPATPPAVATAPAANPASPRLPPPALTPAAPVAPAPAAASGQNAGPNAAQSPVDLTIESDPPEAQISIDNTPVGQSPYVFHADRGKPYVIRAELAGYRSARRRGRFSEAQVVKLSLRPAGGPPKAAPAQASSDSPKPHERHSKPASGPSAPLIISSSETARVFVDGHATGRYTPVTPAEPLELSLGHHVIRLQSDDGKQASKEIVIRSENPPNKLLSVPLE